MSILIYAGERELWWPSSGVATFFLAQVRAAEALVGAESGIGPVASDEVQVDTDRLAVFVRVCMDYVERIHHPQLMLLFSGCLVILLTLNAKANGGWPEETAANTDCLRKARAVVLSP